VFVLMLLESMGIPIPSEAISPFAGYLASEGRMPLFGAIAAGVLGTVVGSPTPTLSTYRVGALELLEDSSEPPGLGLLAQSLGALRRL
jgi:hypothetical protein